MEDAELFTSRGGQSLADRSGAALVQSPRLEMPRFNGRGAQSSARHPIFHVAPEATLGPARARVARPGTPTELLPLEASLIPPAGAVTFVHGARRTQHEVVVAEKKPAGVYAVGFFLRLP